MVAQHDRKLIEKKEMPRPVSEDTMSVSVFAYPEACAAD